MCIQIYKRCICGHREKHGQPNRCDKAEKASHSWFVAAFKGPKLDSKKYCVKMKKDSFGVAEPCAKCRADGGVEASSSRARGAQAPPPPPRAYVSSSHRGQGHGQVAVPRYETQPQPQPQPQLQRHVGHGRPRRPTRYENPRTPPSRPVNSIDYFAPKPDNNAGKQPDQYAKKVMREAEKVSQDTRKVKTRGYHPDHADDIRRRAIAKAREEKRPVEPRNLHEGGGSNHAAPVNTLGNQHDARASSRPAVTPTSSRQAGYPTSSQQAAYPDLRDHPAMKSDVQFAVHHEAFTAGTHYVEDTRKFQDSMVRWGATVHPDRHNIHGARHGDPRQYATVATVDPYQHQPYMAEVQGHARHGDPRQYATGARVNPYEHRPYVAQVEGYDEDEYEASRRSDSPPESQISGFNIAEKLPYNYQRR